MKFPMNLNYDGKGMNVQCSPIWGQVNINNDLVNDAEKFEGWSSEFNLLGLLLYKYSTNINNPPRWLWYIRFINSLKIIIKFYDLIFVWLMLSYQNVINLWIWKSSQHKYSKLYVLLYVSYISLIICLFNILLWRLEGDVNTLRPKQMAAIFQTTFSKGFSWVKMFEFR